MGLGNHRLLALVKDWYKEKKDISLIMGTRPATPEEFIKKSNV